MTVISMVWAKFKNSYWVASGFYSSLSKLSATAFGFINFYILIRLLSLDDYGAWILFISICTVMELIKHGFIRNPLIRFLTITPREQWAELQSASLALNILIGLAQIGATFAAAFFLSEFWNVPQLKSLFIIYTVTTLALIPANHFEIVQQAAMKFREIFISSFVRHGGPFLFVITALFMNWKINLEQLAVVQGASVVLSCIVAFIMNSKLFTFTKRLDKRRMAELFHYGKFTFGTNVSSMIVKNIDTWMLGKMISIEAVTFFNPAIRLSNLVEVPTDTLTFIYFPRVSRDTNSGDSKSVKYFYEKAVSFILAIMIPVVVVIILMADHVIYFIAGSGFEQTPPILKITMLYGLLIPFNRFFGVTLDAIGKAETNFKVVVLTAVLNTISNFVFISYFGTIGAAYGTLFTYVVMVACNQYFLYRKFGISLKSILQLVLVLYQKPFLKFQWGTHLKNP